MTEAQVIVTAVAAGASGLGGAGGAWAALRWYLRSLESRIDGAHATATRAHERIDAIIQAR